MAKPVVINLGDPRNPIEVSQVGSRIRMEFEADFTVPENERTEKGNLRVASTLGNKEFVTASGRTISLGVNAFTKG